ncbi:MAG: D-alanyl-D-alanine carboxypeptidase family protein [Acutalibacteraceae bacterium]
MKWCVRVSIFMLAILMCCWLCCYLVSAETEKVESTVSVSAKSAVLMCANNDSVIFEKNSTDKMSMASTTKIMTTLLALEEAQANNKEVTFGKEMIAEGSSMYLNVGYKLKLTDLATGMMTVSGNDAANAAAIAVAGSIDKFAKLMNNKAKQIGMTSTNFVTPSGLDDDNHYSTALDMAKLMSYAMANKDFAQLTALKNAKVEFISPENMVVSYSNHNRLLSLYKYCNGGKTGFTKKSGRCLVTSAEKDGVKLIAVTLNAPDDWNDHINMYNYGFSKLQAVTNVDKNFSVTVSVVGGAKNRITVKPVKAVEYIKEKDDNTDITKKVIMDSFLYAPLEKGEVVGTVEYYLGNKQLCKIPLVTNEQIEYKPQDKGLFEKISDFFRELF